MATTCDSFFLDAISDEVPESVADAYENAVPDPPSKTFPDSNTNAESSNAIAEPRQTPDRPQENDATSQVMLHFVTGKFRFSNSCELGVLDEHPEVLKAISSNQCLSTSAFLKPALDAVMAELQPLMMIPVAVRLVVISLRLAADILPNHDLLPQHENSRKQQELADFVQQELGQAVPYYQWQGPKVHCGRIQYLMALLEEAVRVMSVPWDLLTEALKLDAAAIHASRHVVHMLVNLGQELAEACGTWSADILRSMQASQKGRQPPRLVTSGLSKAEENGVELAISPESEDELPSPSEFVRSKRATKNARAGAGAPKTPEDDVAESGSAGRLSCFQVPRVPPTHLKQELRSVGKQPCGKEQPAEMPLRTGLMTGRNRQCGAKLHTAQVC